MKQQLHSELNEKTHSKKKKGKKEKEKAGSMCAIFILQTNKAFLMCIFLRETQLQGGKKGYKTGMTLPKVKKV